MKDGPKSSSPQGEQEEFMILINELIACDEFEDIATLKVRRLELYGLTEWIDCPFIAEYWWTVEPKYGRFATEIVPNRRLDSLQIGEMDPEIAVLPRFAGRRAHEAFDA